MTISNWKTLLGAVEKLCRLSKLSPAAVERIVGVPVKQTSDSPYWTYHEAKLSSGLVESVDLRIKKDGSEALIVLALSARADRVGLANDAKDLGTPIRPHIVSPGLGGKPDWEHKYSHEFKIEGQVVNLGYEQRKSKTELVHVSSQWKRPAR